MAASLKVGHYNSATIHTHFELHDVSTHIQVVMACTVVGKHVTA